MKRFFSKRVLVTGGLGFIGSNLAIKLVELGASVTVVDCLVEHHGGNLFNVEPVKGDLDINFTDMRDAAAFAPLVKNRDYIFHLAGQVSHGDSMRDPQLDLGVNCISTMNLVEACRELNPGAKLIYTSTRQVYGVPKNLPVDEQHPVMPIDVNGINKLAAEYYHYLYHRTYDLPSTILRLTNTYGPRQQIRNDRQGFAGIFIRKALKQEGIQIFGDGKQRRDFNHVDDVVDALLRAASTPACFGEIYNLGNQPHSLLDFVDCLRALTDVAFEAIPFPHSKKIIDIGDYYGSYDKFRQATGWQPAIDLQQGLENTLDYYRQFPQHYWT
ncbi:MAG: NAD-dependent epimerase/dehydratase family protein [Pseudomonadales bacterium]|nr:NAD-dependent epimerase/dehydratase family protein [Pseudomonadales bacterium]